METKKRESTGFLIKQRAFLKLYLITNIEADRAYGKQMLEELQAAFKPFGYEPQHSEIYRALHELLEEGVFARTFIPKDGATYQQVAIYKIADQDKANAYKKLVKADLDRCVGILRKALEDNFH